MKKQHSDLRNCLESWEEEFSSRANRVRRLIGDKHWLSDGMHKESILVEFLRRHLPRDLVISRGFIVNGNTSDEPSKEIDVLISNFLLDSPWFSEGDLAIVPPKSCLAQIHVKTEFGLEEITDVLQSCSHSSKVSGIAASRCFFGAVFFERNNIPENEKFLTLISEAQKTLDAPFLPDVISVINGPVIVPKEKTLCAYEANNLALAIFLTSLREKIATNLGASDNSGELSVFLSQLKYNQIH